MDKNSSKLRYSHISRAATEIVEYIKDRSKGISESLKTKWAPYSPKLTQSMLATLARGSKDPLKPHQNRINLS